MNYVAYDMDSANGLRTMAESIHIISHVSISIYDPQFHLLVAIGDPDPVSKMEYWAKKIPDLDRNSPNLRLMSDNVAEVAAKVTTDNKDLIAYAIISDFYFDSKANPHIKQFRDGFPLLDEIVVRAAIDMIALSIKCCLRNLVIVEPEMRQKVDKYIADNLNKKITVKSLSAALKVKIDALITLFHEDIKSTLPKYLQTKRLEEAQRMLAETGMSSSEIALSVGLSTKKLDSYIAKFISNEREAIQK